MDSPTTTLTEGGGAEAAEGGRRVPPALPAAGLEREWGVRVRASAAAAAACARLWRLGGGVEEGALVPVSPWRCLAEAGSAFLVIIAVEDGGPGNRLGRPSGPRWVPMSERESIALSVVPSARLEANSSKNFRVRQTTAPRPNPETLIETPLIETPIQSIIQPQFSSITGTQILSKILRSAGLLNLNAVFLLHVLRLSIEGQLCLTPSSDFRYVRSKEPEVKSPLVSLYRHASLSVTGAACPAVWYPVPPSEQPRLLRACPRCRTPTEQPRLLQSTMFSAWLRGGASCVL